MIEHEAGEVKRLKVRTRHVILVVVVLLAGLGALHLFLSRRSLERRLEALRVAGYPTSFAELAEHTKLPEGTDNAAAVYLRAFAAVKPPADDLNWLFRAKPRRRDKIALRPEPTAEAVADCLAGNQTCLALLHEAGKIEHCRYDWDYSRVVPETRDKMRSCMHLLRLAILHHAERGDAEATLACILDELRLTDSLRKEPALVGHLGRLACLRMAVESLESSLRLTTFKDPQLKEMDTALTRTSSTLDLTETMITERCFMIEMWRDPLRLGLSRPSIPVRMLSGLRGTWFADILDRMGDCVEAAKLPPTERLKRFRQIRDGIQRLSFLHTLTKSATVAVTQSAELDVRYLTYLDLVRIALAIERHRLAAGKTPETLEELVPRYLERVLIDPFDSRPIRYRGTQPGYLLYSVDMDGQDNGGRERNDENRDGPYDLCFIVTR